MVFAAVSVPLNRRSRRRSAAGRQPIPPIIYLVIALITLGYAVWSLTFSRDATPWWAAVLALGMSGMMAMCWWKCRGVEARG